MIPVILALCACATTANSAAAQAAWPLVLRDFIAQTTDIGWNVRIAAGQACPKQHTALGIEFDNLSAYQDKDRALVSQSLNMTDVPQIAAIANTGPASTAGLKAGDDLIAVGTVPVAELLRTDSQAPVAEQLTLLFAEQYPIEAVLLTVRRDGVERDFTIMPVSLCASRVIVDTDDSFGAYSDDSNLALTVGLLQFAANDDEVAMVIGHELAHIILAERFAQIEPSSKEKERQSDQLGAMLTFCAGYDPIKAADFWRRRDKSDGIDFLRGFSHPGSGTRYKTLLAFKPDGPCPATKESVR